MNAPSIDVVEDRLRRTYEQVAARTVAGDGTSNAPGSESDRRRPVLLAAAALVAVLVTGLVVVSGRDGSAPAGTDDVRHLLPGVVPVLDGDDARPLPLTAVESDAETDVLRWATGSGDALGLVVERGLPELDDTTERLRSRGGRGAVRSATDDLVVLTWDEVPGVRVEVSSTGRVTADTLDRFVAGLVGADDETWDDVIGRGGFRAIEDRVVSRFRVDADADFDVDLVGTIHDGLALEVGPGGLPLPVEGCTVDINFATTPGADRTPEADRDDGEPDPVDYVVMTPDDVDVVTIRADGVTHQVPTRSLRPIVDASIGGIRLNREISDDLPECEAARP